MENKYLIGVKTTKIYCLPSCSARVPLPHNVVHFESAVQAERSGFRPCKRCFPDFPYGKWIDDRKAVMLMPPAEFDFLQCLKFFGRSPLEPCHAIDNDALLKLEQFDGEPVLMKIRASGSNRLSIEFLTRRPKKSIRARVAKFVWQWFDLDADLKPFYRMARKDPVLKNIAAKFYGLRIITIPDLFEALCWAIIGQHINLTFAYTLKKRFVEAYGQKFCFDGKNYYLFPGPQVIAKASIAELKGLQLTAKKSEYIIETAKKFIAGELSKKSLLTGDGFETARDKLMQLRGVGQWTVDYVSLRCLGDPAALPVNDVGLQNAVRRQLGLSHKPSANEIRRFSGSWQNWQAYATFYLWASLI
jgi:DNA-3-methyladenine glycosylase II